MSEITAKLRRIADLLNSIGSCSMASTVSEAADALEEFIGSGRYSIGTWDSEHECFTPQAECSTPWLNVDIHGLRRHLKELKACGYSCHRHQGDSDPAVLVERTDGEPEVKVLERWTKG